MADEGKQQPNLRTSGIAAHPSTLVPGIPRFIFSVPDGWVVDQAPNALCVVRQPDEVDGFWVNAIISHDKVPRSVDFKQAAITTWARLKRSFPSATEHGERMVRFGDLPVYTRGVELEGAGGRPLAQLQAMFFAPATDTGQVVDFFQIIGTTPLDTATQNTSRFIEIVASFRFV